jgi:hypothetical protein
VGHYPEEEIGRPMINAILRQECEHHIILKNRLAAYKVCECAGLSWQARIEYVDALIDLMYVEDTITSKEWNELRG